MKITIETYEIDLSMELLSLLRSQIQDDPKDNEKGGILLGRIVDDQIQILKISFPTSLDKSSRTTFERHKFSAQIIINYEFTNSSGQIIYLGEWHTHPEAIPTPSDTDMKMIQSQYHKNKILTPFLILIIQGIEKAYVGVYDGSSINSCLI